MKKYLILLVIVCSTLMGCNQKEKGGYDEKGIITEVDSGGNRILVDETDIGLIWISLPEHGDIKGYEVGQEVVIWIDGGIDESSPAQAKALNIEFLDRQTTEKNITGKPELHKFDFKNHEFPPYLPGFIKVDEARYKMETGGYRWEKGNTTTLTDAASPQQIAENFKAIVLEPNSKVSIQIEQDPALSVYLWNSEREKVTIEGTQITIPANKGRHIYEVVAKWSNGEVSYTIVVEVE